ncbi:MAG: aminopeptidase [Nitrososphaerales archaeon]
MSTSRNAKKSKNSKVYAKLANRVVSDSQRLRKGESVTVETWNNGLDFAREVVKEARRLGAFPLLILEDEEAYLEGVKNSPKDSLGKMGKHEYSLLTSTDAYVFIPGPILAVYSPLIPREDANAATAYNSSWYESAEKAKVRGVRMSFGYVGKEYAKLLGKTLDQVVDNQIKASLVDLQKLRARGQPVMDALQEGAAAEIETGSNSLSFTLKGELGIEDGVVDDADLTSGNNISAIVPGMIWKNVDPATVSGKVRITSTVSRLGVVEDALLEFENGKLVKWTSKSPKTQKILDTLIRAVPEDGRVFSILSVGVNPEMKFGFAQDRSADGSIGLAGFGFTAIARAGTLKVNGRAVV